MGCQEWGLDVVKEVDPEVYRICRQEQDRQAKTLELIASENHVSRAVMRIVGSVFTNKYAEGYPGKRYYGGCEFMDAVENLARDRAKQLFGAEHVNVQPHSGTQANMAVYMAVLQPGDTLLALDLDHGGHLSHGKSVNFSGQLYKVCTYGVDAKSERFDYNAIREKARQSRPRMIVCGASAYSRTIDFEAFADIAAEVGAYLLADIAHIAGMVAVGLHPSPVPVADFVTTTTHKTLRGPRAGMIMCKAGHAQAIDRTVFPGIQGGPLMHVIAGKAVAFAEALRPEFKLYQQQILTNAKALADTLAAAGYRLVSGGTDNHLMLVDLRTVLPDVTGRMAEGWLESASIIVNKNMIPFDDRRPAETSGLRLGTPALTTRGMKVDQMNAIAQLIHRVLDSRGDDRVVQKVRGEVRQLCEQFPLPH